MWILSSPFIHQQKNVQFIVRKIKQSFTFRFSSALTHIYLRPNENNSDTEYEHFLANHVVPCLVL